MKRMIIVIIMKRMVKDNILYNNMHVFVNTDRCHILLFLPSSISLFFLPPYQSTSIHPSFPTSLSFPPSFLPILYPISLFPFPLSLLPINPVPPPNTLEIYNIKNRHRGSCKYYTHVRKDYIYLAPEWNVALTHVTKFSKGNIYTCKHWGERACMCVSVCLCACVRDCLDWKWMWKTEREKERSVRYINYKANSRLEETGPWIQGERAKDNERMPGSR